MYQLVMSTIHDEARHEKFDSDASVPYIEDPMIAVQAFTSYCNRLARYYGVTFEMGENVSETTVLSAFAAVNFIGRPATIYVELQKPSARDNVEDILRLMQAKAKFTHQIVPEA